MNTVDHFDPETTDYTNLDNWPNSIENYAVQSDTCPPLTTWGNAAGSWEVEPDHRCKPAGGDHCTHGNDCTLTQNCVNELGGFVCVDKCDPECVGNTECDGNENDGYNCVCKVHYTGASCETFNGCDGVTCNGNGSCFEDGDEPSCQCDPGWDGENCDIQVPNCDPACIEGQGTCILDNGNSICDCNSGLTGDQCETAVCDPVCVNGGNCSYDSDSQESLCNCPSEFGGDACQIDLCAAKGCVNGSCFILQEEPVCMCDAGWLGDLCDQEDPECSEEQEAALTCDNGNCLVQSGNAICNCVANWSGAACDVPVCDPVCQNGGLCEEVSENQHECNCASGWKGTVCDEVDTVCSTDQENNLSCDNGNCVLDDGVPFCECTAGFSGATCDVPECDPACVNGTCVEGENEGDPNVCNCNEGFEGDSCETQIDPCDDLTCVNGTCNAISASEAECNCSSGWKGDACDVVDTVCSEAQENNLNCINGDCVLDDGIPTCQCATGFSGADCSVAVCDPECVDGQGTCVEGKNDGDSNVCECNEGFEGATCGDQIDPCDALPCVNGVCNPISLLEAECNCSSGWIGDACDEEDTECTVDQIANLVCDNGDCFVQSGEPTCQCVPNFTGPDCSIPICSPACVNGGTCIENENEDLVCDCPEGFSGVSCEINACDLITCVNGNCIIDDGEGVCECNEGFEGDSCETQSCTCVFGSCDENMQCQCPVGFTGDNCEILPCQNCVCQDESADGEECAADEGSSTGVKEHPDGTGGCPPKLVQYSLVNADVLSVSVGFDPNQVMGTHLDGKSYIGVGVAREAENDPTRDAIMTRYNLCPDISSYGSETDATTTSVSIAEDPNTADCASELAWTFKSGNAGQNDMFGYVAVSPDKTYVIASGVKAISNTKMVRWLVKIDAANGQKIWETQSPQNEAMFGQRSGYESIVFTSDGGFVAAGFADYANPSEFPNFKSGGQVDSGSPIYQKFSAAVASANEMAAWPTPEWTYKCGDIQDGGAISCGTGTPIDSSVSSMRLFTMSNKQLIVSTLRPNVVLVLNADTGAEEAFFEGGPNDKYQDIEVSEDENGIVQGLVVGGLAAAQDTATLGCSSTEDGFCVTWKGLAVRLNLDLDGENQITQVWRKTFNNFSGGKKDYSDVPAFGDVMIYTECWSITGLN